MLPARRPGPKYHPRQSSASVWRSPSLLPVCRRLRHGATGTPCCLSRHLIIRDPVITSALVPRRLSYDAPVPVQISRSMPLELGSRLNHYDVVTLIGEGRWVRSIGRPIRAASRRGAQSAAQRCRGRSWTARTIQGEAAPSPRESSQHRHDLTPWRNRRSALPHDGAVEGRRLDATYGRRSVPERFLAIIVRLPTQWPRRMLRDHASRSQAAECDGRPRRTSEGARFRPGQVCPGPLGRQPPSDRSTMMQTQEA